MSINHIETEDLRRMEGKGGLILQGCGGELQEWLDGINEMFTEAGILKNGAKFQDIFAFEYNDSPCLLYPLRVWTWRLGNLPCGVCRPMRLSVAHGSLILSPTVWAGLSGNRRRSRKSRTAR